MTTFKDVRETALWLRYELWLRQLWSTVEY